MFLRLSQKLGEGSLGVCRCTYQEECGKETVARAVVRGRDWIGRNASTARRLESCVIVAVSSRCRSWDSMTGLLSFGKGRDSNMQLAGRVQELEQLRY